MVRDFSNIPDSAVYFRGNRAVHKNLKDASQSAFILHTKEPYTAPPENALRRIAKEHFKDEFEIVYRKIGKRDQKETKIIFGLPKKFDKDARVAFLEEVQEYAYIKTPSPST
jgi:hypothetical protein